MSDPAMREAFERYALTHALSLEPDDKVPERYRWGVTHTTWIHWQAAYQAGLAAGAKAEREACAKVCDNEHKAWVNFRATANPRASETRITSYDAKAAVAHALAAAIRAREEKR